MSLPSLRVDAFTVGIAAADPEGPPHRPHLRPRGRHLAHAPGHQQADPEEDLYGAVESAYSQGWRRMKLYFLTGLPTETDEDTLGIAELARNCVEIGQGAHQRARRSRCRSAGSCPSRSRRSSGSARTPSPSCSRKIGLLRDDAPPRPRACSSSGTTRRPRLVEGLVSRGDRRLGPVIEDVWRHGGTFQEWSEHFDLELWVDAMAAPRARRSTGTSTATAPRTRSCPWDHLSAGLHKDFLWQDWRDALDEVGLEDCRWTPCYDCGACTGYGIEHIVASATPPAGGSQGTGQDLGRGGAVPGRAARPHAGRAGAPAGSAPMRVRFRFTQAGQGPLHQPPRRRPPLGAGAAPGRAAGGLHRGLLAPAQGALRAGPVHRPRVAGRVPRHRLPRARGADARPRRPCPSCSRRCCPTGSTCEAAAVIDRPARPRCSRRSPAARGRIEVAGPRPSTLRRAPSTRAPRRAPSSSSPAQRKGNDVTDDLRPAIAGPRPSASTGPTLDRGAVLDAELATQPRGAAPRRAAAPPLDPTRSTEGRVLPNPPMDHARRRPASEPLSLALGATSAPHAEARAS